MSILESSSKTAKQPRYKALGFESYDAYLASERWAAFRARYYSKRPRKCAKCGSTKNLDLHHKSYKRLGQEQLDDVIPLCRRDHEALHQSHTGKSLWKATNKFIGQPAKQTRKQRRKRQKKWEASVASVGIKAAVVADPMRPLPLPRKKRPTQAQILALRGVKLPMPIEELTKGEAERILRNRKITMRGADPARASPFVRRTKNGDSRITEHGRTNLAASAMEAVPPVYL